VHTVAATFRQQAAMMGEVQTLYVRLATPTPVIPTHLSPDDLPPSNSPSSSRLSWIAGLLLISLTVAFSVVVSAPRPSDSSDRTPLGVLQTRSPPALKLRPQSSNNFAYDVKDTNWAALRHDLEKLVAVCQCGPVRRRHPTPATTTPTRAPLCAAAAAARQSRFVG